MLHFSKRMLQMAADHQNLENGFKCFQSLETLLGD